MADGENRKLVEARRKSDEAASALTIWFFSIVSTLVALVLGVLVAFTTAKSITEPLTKLMKVSRQIGDTGDLEHSIDVKREDEIGELARSFAKMVNYLKEMAAVSESIAGGDLTVEVKPRSSHDTLGNAFARMVEGLGTTGAQRARCFGASGQRQRAGGERLRRFGQDRAAGFLGHRRSHQHHARDERERAEHGEEHASAGFQRK